MVPSVGIWGRRELVVERVIIDDQEGTGWEEFGIRVSEDVEVEIESGRELEGRLGLDGLGPSKEREGEERRDEQE